MSKPWGISFPAAWVDVPNPNPGDDDTPVREQAQALGATQTQKAEGIWAGRDGTIWFVGSYGGGPDAEDEEDRSAAAHSGQIWKYDPATATLELVALFPVGSEFDGPTTLRPVRTALRSPARMARTASGSSALRTTVAPFNSGSTR